MSLMVREGDERRALVDYAFRQASVRPQALRDVAARPRSAPFGIRAHARHRDKSLAEADQLAVEGGGDALGEDEVEHGSGGLGR
ncbi:hypothetical protein [Streptomyces canus]|uniref:hypothetical protein n=1 Tax=Streptomyces canus TaxID=58343 RepID=UPI002DD80DC0|nr:hypothetical protein [Streptomyces canus]WSD83693.1 hypothetical protein OG925_05035 [Streptomyces canus]